MITITPSALLKGLRATFFRTYGPGPQGLVEMLSTMVKSDSDLETHLVMGELPTVREFVDERVAVTFGDTTYALTNQKWEQTIHILRDHIEDQKLNSITNVVNTMAAKAKRHPWHLVVDLLINGATTGNNSYDGVTFFNDTHPNRGSSGAQDNNLAGTGTDLADLKLDFTTKRTAMKRFLDEGGEYFFDEIGADDLAVVCPPELETTFDELFSADKISNTTNVLKGAVSQVIAPPRLSDADDWYLLYKGDLGKPFIFQDRVPMTASMLDNAQNDAGFDRDVYKFGTRARYAAGYQRWQCAVRTTN